ncbi:MAG: prepilin-type N-terminal cleavage/methylation domain-containing protein [Akkermansiaceae bacterium]|nr:prepilin-type N-terminal cleavage/methylation domain-containing protein [Akkermansiaceae bacterium]
MKTKFHSFPSASAKGFTMLELLVAMSVTVVLLGMVTFMTGVSMDGYKGSRDKVLGGRQAKEAHEAITQDFEAMVARADGSEAMWLYAGVEPELDGDVVGSTTLAGPANKKIVNSCRLIFFTGAPDRYDGDIGGANDNGGDVSAVSYRLVYRDQISGAAANAVGAFPSYTLYRHLVDPDDTFTNVLGQTDLTAPVNPPAPAPPVVNQFTDTLDFTAENVLAENIYQMTVTFLVQQANGVSRFTIGANAGQQQYHSLVIRGNGILSKADAASAEVEEEGQLVGVEIGMTVLSERGLVMTQKGGMSRQEIINEYGTHYTDTVSVPRF